MILQFTLDQMKAALIKAGYEISLETEIDTVKVTHSHSSDRDVKVWVVKYKGESMADWRGFGTSRIEYVFKQELEKRLLNELF